MKHKSDIIFANAEIPSEHDFQQIIRILNFDSKRETANTKQLIVYLQAEIMGKNTFDLHKILNYRYI